MSDNTQKLEEMTEAEAIAAHRGDVNTSEKPSKKDTKLSFKETVASRLAESAPTIADRIVDKMKNDEIDRRVEIGLRAVQHKDKLEKEFAKMRPDQKAVTLDSEGKHSILESFSEAKFKERTKAQETITKFEKAFDKAFDENSTQAWNDLDQLMK